MPIKKARFIFTILYVCGLLVLLFSILFKGILSIFLAIIAFLLLILSAFVIFKYWKCKHCDRSLPLQGAYSITHCPYCGNDIN